MTRSEERLREMLAESGIADEGSERLLECLSALDRSVDDTPPQPGPELAALMARAGGAARTTLLPRRHGRRVLVAGAVAFGTVAAGGIAAAANELPPDAQRFVAEFSERYLPFELPRPDVRPENREEDEPDQPVTTWQDQGDDVPPPVLPGSAPTPAKSPEAGSRKEPTPSPSTLPTPSSSVLPEPEQVDPTGEPSPAPDQEPTGDGDPETTDGDPQAGPDGGVTQSPGTGDSTGTEVVPAPSGGASPSGSSEPDPIVNSRTEAEPSSTATP